MAPIIRTGIDWSVSNEILSVLTLTVSLKYSVNNLLSIFRSKRRRNGSVLSGLKTLTDNGSVVLISATKFPFMSCTKSLVMLMKVSSEEVARSVSCFISFLSVKLSFSISTVLSLPRERFSPPVSV